MMLALPTLSTFMVNVIKKTELRKKYANCAYIYVFWADNTVKGCFQGYSVGINGVLVIEQWRSDI